MADHLRWFKVWVSLLNDGDFAEMSLEDIGRWTLLGALIADDGTKGRLDVPGTGKRLCQVLRVGGVDAAKVVLFRFKNLTIEEGQNKGVTFCVTWQNWQKYQRDSSADRTRKWRRTKRREEKKRKEENRIPPSQSFPRGETVSLRDRARGIVEFLNVEAGRNFPVEGKAGEENIRWPLGRLKVGFTGEDCELVIRYAVHQLKGTEKEVFLNPATLFRPKNFQINLQAAKRWKAKIEETPQERFEPRIAKEPVMAKEKFLEGVRSVIEAVEKAEAKPGEGDAG